MPTDFLYLCEFVIFKLQTIAYINTKWEKGNRNFRDNTGILVFHEGVISANVNDGADHIVLHKNPPPGHRGRTMFLGISPCTYRIEIG